MYRVLDTESALNERRKATITENVPYEIQGEIHTVEKRIANGEMTTLEFSKPLGELLTYGSVENLQGVISKVALDAEFGREEVPLLYSPIYETIQDANFPKVFEADWAMSGNCVFLEHVEGEEVKYGSLQAEEGPVAKIQIFTTGYQMTKEMALYNETYKLENLSRSVGRAHNALLNHIHLAPIIEASYKAANKTAKVTPADADAPPFMVYYETLAKALKDARTAKRPGSVLLASSADQVEIEQALNGGHSVNGTQYAALNGIGTVIFYDGYEVKVGKELHEYPGVPAGKAYLIRPKAGFKELLKVPLTNITGNEDISRLIEEQMVWFTARGVFAAIEENVQEISFK